MRRWWALVLVAAGLLLAVWLRPRPGVPSKRAPGVAEVAGRGVSPGRWSTVAVESAAGEVEDRVLVEGRVVERGTRTPVAGATVRLAGIATAEATSDADGSFQLFAPRGSRGRLVAHQGRRFGRGAIVDLQEEPAPQVIELVPALTVHGRVLDAEGAPVAGAEVRIYIGTFSWRAVPEAREPLVDERALTDAEGSYALQGVPRGSYRIDARASGFGTRRSMVLVEDEDVIEDFMLSRAARLSGRVVAPGGRPLHAPVLLFLSSREQVTSDADGGFDFAELSPGSFSMMALDPANGVAEQQVELQAGESRELTLELRAGAVVEGTVRHADGRAAAGATVHVGRNVTVRTDASGRYRLAGLHGGGHVLTVGEGTDVLASADVRLRDDEQRSGVDLTLVEGRHAIAGLVTDAAGQPVPNEELTLTIGEVRRRVRCGADGRFRADALPDGPGELTLFDGHDLISHSVAEDDADVRVTLPRRALLRGTVVGGRGWPVASLHVELSGATGVERVQSSDGAGRFEIDGLSPGVYRLEVTAPDGSCGSQEVTVTDAPMTEVSVRLEPGGEVIGRVVDRNGRPRANVTVTGGTGAAQTGADGAFRLTAAPGAVVLSFASDDDNVVSDSRSVAVSSGARVDVGAVTLIDARPGGGDDEPQGFDGMEAQNRDGQATVASVDPGSAAARAGIVAGDLLFAIDGNDVSGLGGGSIDELLRGTPGATVEVTFAHPDAPAQTVTLVLSASTEPND